VNRSIKRTVESTLDARLGWSSDGSDGGPPETPQGKAPPKAEPTERDGNMNSPWKSTGGTQPALPLPPGHKWTRDESTEKISRHW
jgi:hypothetical protein